MFKVSAKDKLKKKMHRIEKTMRGMVLSYFAVIEPEIDKIIRLYSFPTISQYDKYIKILGRKNVPMDIKKQLFRICLTKLKKNYKLYKETADYLLDNFGHHVDTRDKMAHWICDYEDAAVSHYKKTKELTFYTVNKDGTHTEKHFNADKISLMEAYLNMTTIYVKGIWARLHTDRAHKYRHYY